MLEPSRAKLDTLAALVASQAIHPRIDGVHPLDHVAAAFTRLSEGAVLGKLVIDVAGAAGR